jgi:mono/diheme cytochrome c family protein
MQQATFAIFLAALVVGAALVIFYTRRFSDRPRLTKVPASLRPGDPDDVLESVRLTRILRWGVALTLFFAAFMFVYYFNEPGRMRKADKTVLQKSIDQGHYYFSVREDPVTGKPPDKRTGDPKGPPIECARCHGVNQQGGTNEFLDPNTGKKRTIQVPELRHVFARYAKPPGFPVIKDAKQFVRETVERGRVGTDMPTWGNRFGGPLTDQQLDDIANFLESIQEPITTPVAADGKTIFASFCAPCHGQGGAGGSGPSMTGGSEKVEFPNIDDHIAFVKAGSPKGPYGTRGKGTGSMPAWSGTLTDEQVRAVVEYERSL